jgi:hypothetical protein
MCLCGVPRRLAISLRVFCCGVADYLSIYPNYGYTSTATTDPRLITNVTGAAWCLGFGIVFHSPYDVPLVRCPVSYPLTSTLSPNSFGSVVPPVVECGFLTDRGDYRNSSGQVLGARQVRCQVPPCALDQFGRNCQTPVTLLLIVNGQPTTSNSKFYYIPAAPQVRSVSPAEGDLRSDTTITVTGLGISTTPCVPVPTSLPPLLSVPLIERRCLSRYTTCRIDNRLVVGTVLAVCSASIVSVIVVF